MLLPFFSLLFTFLFPTFLTGLWEASRGGVEPGWVHELSARRQHGTLPRVPACSGPPSRHLPAAAPLSAAARQRAHVHQHQLPAGPGPTGPVLLPQGAVCVTWPLPSQPNPVTLQHNNATTTAPWNALWNGCALVLASLCFIETFSVSPAASGLASLPASPLCIVLRLPSWGWRTQSHALWCYPPSTYLHLPVTLPVNHALQHTSARPFCFDCLPHFPLFYVLVQAIRIVYRIVTQDVSFLFVFFFFFFFFLLRFPKLCCPAVIGSDPLFLATCFFRFLVCPSIICLPLWHSCNILYVWRCVLVKNKRKKKTTCDIGKQIVMTWTTPLMTVNDRVVIRQDVNRRSLNWIAHYSS